MGDGVPECLDTGALQVFGQHRVGRINQLQLEDKKVQINLQHNQWCCLLCESPMIPWGCEGSPAGPPELPGSGTLGCGGFHTLSKTSGR